MTKKYTTPREVMEALLAGKKLTLEGWELDKYMCLEGDNVVDQDEWQHTALAFTNYQEYAPQKKYLTDISELATVRKVRIEYPEWVYAPERVYALQRTNGNEWRLVNLESVSIALTNKWPVEILEEV